MSLYSRVIVPRAVADEISSSKGRLPEGNILANSRIEVRELSGELDRLLKAELDAGEASVIQLALEIGNVEVLIDEKKARRVANGVYGLNVLGTGGLLLRAKKRGLIQNVRPLFEAIRANGYFISDRLMEGIVAAAGE